MNDKEYINLLEQRVGELRYYIYCLVKEKKEMVEELQKWTSMAMEFQEKFVELKNKGE